MKKIILILFTYIVDTSLYFRYNNINLKAFIIINWRNYII